MKCSHVVASAFTIAVLSTALGSCRNPTEVIPTLPPVDSTTVLLFDDFDQENNGVALFNWANFKQWNVVAGCVDLHGNGFRDVQPGYGLYLDLDGSCPQLGAGTLESKTTLSLDPGNYVLEYWLAGNQQLAGADTVVVSLGDIYREQIRLDWKTPFKLYTRTISVAQPTSVKLRFAHSGKDEQGILLDLVRLRRAE